MAQRNPFGGNFYTNPKRGGSSQQSQPRAYQKFNYQPNVPRGNTRGRRWNRFTDDQSKEVPGSDVPAEAIFTFPYLTDDKTISFFKDHGRILFLIRGPPGTAKDSLADLIHETFPISKVLSAKKYSKQPFVKKANYKDPSSSRYLGQSHDWCLESLQNSLNDGNPIIILSNSHVRAKEIDFYLDTVRSYAYTIVVAETIWKFNVHQEVLVNTNQQQLDKDYFENRLKQWDNYVPWYTGWFLNPADSSHLQNYAFSLVDQLLDNGTLRSELDLPPEISSGKTLFSQERELFAICFCCHTGFSKEGREHYKNVEVINSIGKLSTLSVLGFIVEPQYLLALVKLEPDQVPLYTLQKPRERDCFRGPASSSSAAELFVSAPEDAERKDCSDDDELSVLEAEMRNVNIKSRSIKYADLSKIAMHSKETFSDKRSNSLQSTWPKELPHMDELSIIVIGTRGNPRFPYIENPRNFLYKFFNDAKNKSYSSPTRINKGILYKADFGKYIFFPPTIFSFGAIFTGLY